ncbi:MAG: type IX secretion system protein PorQ [Bacteroidota bacterium]
MRLFIACFCVSLAHFSVAQIGGKLDFQVLSAVSNPRSAALGGLNISSTDQDIALVMDNIAILDSIESGSVFVNISPFFSDAISASFSSSLNLGALGDVGIGLIYFDYGTFDRTSASGEDLGEFTAQDYAVSIGKSHRLGAFVLGGAIKFANSSIDGFQSSAALLDIGGLFEVNQLWSFGMTFRNLGARLRDYSANTTTSLPLDIRVGTTFKPRYMPLRFTITSRNLISENSLAREDEINSNKTIEKVLRGLQIGTELLLSQHFHLLVGYNHKRKQELGLQQTGAGAGFSYGLMLQVRKIQFRFSRATFHAAGGSSFISLKTNLNSFKSIL